MPSYREAAGELRGIARRAEGRLAGKRITAYFGPDGIIDRVEIEEAGGK